MDDYNYWLATENGPNALRPRSRNPQFNRRRHYNFAESQRGGGDSAHEAVPRTVYGPYRPSQNQKCPHSGSRAREIKLSGVLRPFQVFITNRFLKAETNHLFRTGLVQVQLTK